MTGDQRESDPAVYERGQDAIAEEPKPPQSTRSGKGVQIHINTNDPDWLDKTGEAHLTAAHAMWFDPREFKGPPIMIEGDPSLIKGLTGNE